MAKIDELQAEIETLIAKNDELKKGFAENNDEIKSLGSQIATMGKENDDLKAENELLKEELSSLSTTETTISVEVKKPVIPEDTFTAIVNDPETGEKVKKKFRFTIAQFNFNRQIITASDALADEKIRQELAEIGAGCIAEVV